MFGVAAVVVSSDCQTLRPNKKKRKRGIFGPESLSGCMSASSFATAVLPTLAAAESSPRLAEQTQSGSSKIRSQRPERENSL